MSAARSATRSAAGGVIRVDQCRICGGSFEQERKRGRPRSLCSSCAGSAERIAEKQRAYREANRERLAAKQRAYYEANREGIAEKQRAYREANRERLAEKQRAYYEANRERLAEKKRAYREANREQIAEKKRAYYEANREQIAEKQRAYRDQMKTGERIAPSRWHCDECGEPLARRTEDGLCGFCRQGIAA